MRRLRKTETRSRELVEIFADVVKATATDCTLTVCYPSGKFETIDCPEINYVFGNAKYIKDKLDDLSVPANGGDLKFPLIALMCPVNEKRGFDGMFSESKVRVLIACSTRRAFSNEERCVYSFQNILRPIYLNFLRALREDGRFDFGGRDLIPHQYSENYSYGRYGAFTGAGEEVSEPIDAIDISNLELKVKQPKCNL